MDGSKVRISGWCPSPDFTTVDRWNPANHGGYLKPCKWDKLPTSTGAGFPPSTVGNKDVEKKTKDSDQSLLQSSGTSSSMIAGKYGLNASTRRKQSVMWHYLRLVHPRNLTVTPKEYLIKPWKDSPSGCPVGSSGERWGSVGITLIYQWCALYTPEN